MADSTPIPLICVGEGGTASALDPRQQRWAAANGFAGQRGRLLALPDEAGNVAAYLFGLGPEADRPPLVLGLAGAAVDAGAYLLAGNPGDPTLAEVAAAARASRATPTARPSTAHRSCR